MEMVWPIALIVFSNIVYQVCAKEVPKDMNAMASLTITYSVGAICSAIAYRIMQRDGSLLHEYTKINAAPILLGVSIVGLEAGFIYAYKNGWTVSSASIVQSTFLSAALILVGAVFYHETITVNKLIGMAFCLVGLYFINK